MNYQEFKEKIADEIKEYLPKEFSDASVLIESIKKNNGVVRDGLCILKPEENTGPGSYYVSPISYLDEYFADYQNGYEFSDILKDIVQKQIGYNMSNDTVAPIFQYEKMKDKIVLQVVNEERNRERLRNAPHRTELDMAITYCIYHQSEQGLSSLLITDSLLDSWGITEEELYKTAMENSEKKLPAVFRSVDDVIKDMIIKERFGIDPKSLSPKDRAHIEKMLPKQEKTPLHVLTTEQEIKGAVALFYPHIREMIAEQLDSNYYVLPSSVNEVLILPDDGIVPLEALKNMVGDTNQMDDCIIPEDVLSNEVYYYDKNTRELTVAGDEMEEDFEIE